MVGLHKEKKTTAQTTKMLYRNRLVGLKQSDLDFLEVYGQLGARGAATKLGIEVNRVYQRIYRLKKLTEKAQIITNQINTMKNKYPRVRKSLTVIPLEEWEHR